MLDYSFLSEHKFPKQDLARLSFCGSRPKQLKELLDSLALDQDFKAITLFSKLVSEVIRLNTKPSHRFELLSLMQPKVRMCVYRLQEAFVKQGFFCTEADNQRIVMILNLLYVLTEGYLATLKQLFTSFKPDINLKKTVIFFSIRNLGFLHLNSLFFYTRQPRHLWKTLNNLFRLSVALNVDQKDIPDESLEHRNDMSCKMAYLQVVAMAFSQPNHLRQVELLNLYYALEVWSEYIEIEKLDPQNHRDAFYIVNLKSHQSPMYHSRFDNSEGDKNLYSICFLSLTAQLQNDVQLLQLLRLPLQQQQSLFIHLSEHWCKIFERREPRYHVKLAIKVCFGLNHSHHLLSGGLTDEHSMLLANNIQSVNTYNIHDVKVLTLSVIDKSSQGFCLCWPLGQHLLMKSGEVLLFEQSKEKTWALGRVEWLQNRDNRVFVGVQIISFDVLPVELSIANKGANSSTFFKVLLLESSLTHQDSTLLTPSIPFLPKQNVILRRSGNCKNAQLNRIISSSGIVTQFEFEV